MGLIVYKIIKIMIISLVTIYQLYIILNYNNNNYIFEFYFIIIINNIWNTIIKNKYINIFFYI